MPRRGVCAMTRCISLTIYLFVITLIPAYAQNASPAELERNAALCERAIVSGARMGGVPQEVLHAISLTETGRQQGGRLRPWPWAVNLEGQGHWFATRAEALAFARHSLAEGRRSFDVGCFQINYKYHGHNFTSLESMFEPEVGAAYAARFLGDLYRESGDWSRAAGAYHSRTPHYARIYRARFDRIHARVAGTPITVAAAPAEAEDGTPRRTRTKMSRGPLIIRVEPRQPENWREASGQGRMAALNTVRREKALPDAVASETARSAAADEADDATEDAGWEPASGTRRYGIQ